MYTTGKPLSHTHTQHTPAVNSFTSIISAQSDSWSASFHLLSHEATDKRVFISYTVHYVQANKEQQSGLKMKHVLPMRLGVAEKCENYFDVPATGATVYTKSAVFESTVKV